MTPESAGSQSIQASYPWNLKAVKTLSRFHARNSRSRYFGYAIYAVCILVGSMALRNILLGVGPALLNAGILLVAVYWMLLRIWVAEIRMKRQLARFPVGDASADWALGEDSIRVSWGGLVTTTMRWPYIERCLIGSAGFLFYSIGRRPFWLPREAFAADSEFQKAEALIRAKTTVGPLR